MPFDAFKASADSVTVSTEAFKKEGDHAPVQGELNKVQAELNKIKGLMSPLDKKEAKLANLAIEKELEAAIPDVEYDGYYSFEDAYNHKAKDWESAKKLITTGILNTVQTFIAGRALQVIDTIGDENMIFDLDLDDAKSALGKLGSLSEAEINEIGGKWASNEASKKKPKPGMGRGVIDSEGNVIGENN